MADEKHRRASSPGSEPEVEHSDHAGSHPDPVSVNTPPGGLAEHRQASVKAENPLSGVSEAELGRMVEEYCARQGFDTEEDLVCPLPAWDSPRFSRTCFKGLTNSI